MPSRGHPRQVVGVATVLACLSCGSREPLPPPADTAATSLRLTAPAPAGPVQIEMKNLQLHLDDGIVLNVRGLRGEMVSKTPAPPLFDDPSSYELRVFTGDLGMDMTSLANLMNHHVFAYEDAPLKDISVEIRDGMLRQKGKLHKGLWVPFSMRATPAATPDGRLLLHTESVKALGIPTTKLLDILGLTLSDLMKVDTERGVEIKEDDVIISPERVLPPPKIKGHLARAEIANGELREVFTTADGRAVRALTPPDPMARNYLYFSGSMIRFGKLTMTGTDLQLIDARCERSVRFLPREVQRAARRWLLEEHAGEGTQVVHAGFCRSESGPRPATLGRRAGEGQMTRLAW